MGKFYLEKVYLEWQVSVANVLLGAVSFLILIYNEGDLINICLENVECILSFE